MQSFPSFEKSRRRRSRSRRGAKRLSGLNVRSCPAVAQSNRLRWGIRDGIESVESTTTTAAAAAATATSLENWHKAE
uniref:Uncharacterized protein n=1 Tax=Caenorhabditis japonica TaxID=281687 RepID=A0A8R1IGX6_CAEJA